MIVYRPRGLRGPLGDDTKPRVPLKTIAKWTAIVMVAMWLLDNPWRSTLR